MGGLCSKQNPTKVPNPYADCQEKQYQLQRDAAIPSTKMVSMTPPDVPVVEEKNKKKKQVDEESPTPRSAVASRHSNASASDDEFYDGIPRYGNGRTSSQKSRSSRLNKLQASEASSILGRASSFGLDRAVEVLDTLGSSVTNLNVKGGFVSGSTAKNNELSILAFEVANTIVKGSNLMQSLSRRSIRQLKDVVFQTEGIQNLISKDTDELLTIVAADKREELKIFLCEVVRFGNRCKDPQWHNLDRFFEKRSRDRTPQKQLRDAADSVMLQLMTLVQLTAELYQELNTLDRLEEEYQRKRLEELRYNPGQRGDRDNSLNILAAEIKSEKKLVKNLKKKSLWSRSMEEVMEKLVDVVLYLNQEIDTIFGNPGPSETPETDGMSRQQRLGPAGLDLHYANIILLIDSIVARSSSMPPNSRDTLYQSLPPHVKASLRSKLQSFRVDKELTIVEIKNVMEKTLYWLVAIATNTAKAHHGFGWVGEWANTTGSDLSQRMVGSIDVMQIETLHHADRHKTEAYIIDLLLWLNYLVSRSSLRNNGADRTVKPSLKGAGHPKSTVLENMDDNSEGRSHDVGVMRHSNDSGFEEENFERTRTGDGSTAVDETSSTGNTFLDLGHGDATSLGDIDRV